MARDSSPPITHVNTAILCGGEGKRLWPESRRDMPKQFGSFGTDSPMISATAKRLQALNQTVTVNQSLAIGSQQHGFLIAEHVAEYGFETVLEPCARDSAAAIVAVSCLLMQRGEGEVPVVVCPSDHLIKDTTAFCADVIKAAAATNDYEIVLLGISPTHAETGFGYLELSETQAGEFGSPVAQFHEKPDLPRAEEYLKNPSMMWNSGIFVFKPARLNALMQRLNPDMLQKCQEAVAGAKDDLQRLVLHDEAFQKIAPVSFDYEVVERANSIGAIRASFDWADLGSWKAVSETFERDTNDSVNVGNAINVGSKNTFVSSSGPLIVTHDVEDIVAVATPDAVLVTRQDNSQNVKALVELLGHDHNEMNSHRRVYRPWGWYESVVMGDRFHVKRICVKPKAVLSLQKHYHRAEHWVVVEGIALVEIDNETRQMTENESTYVPLGAVHRLSNPGKIPLVIIEVQTGSYLGEDDIVRLDDVYGRKGTS